MKNPAEGRSPIRLLTGLNVE